ncbi:MAG: arsenic transporter [Firmicutes bacterium]|nr:arsenic transporter [Bacillota bacterium]
MQSLLAVALFVVVLVLVIWQPRGLSIGWPAAVGGALAVLLGIVTPAEVGQVVGIVWDATLAFVAVILISLVLDAVGFFEWAALHMVRRAGGSGARLFVYSIILGALVAALFANDGAALILTPIVYEQVKALRLSSAAILAFVMAGGFVADSTSLPLVVSNLVNIVSADFFHIGFVGYSARMLPVDLAALAASLLALYLYFRRDLPERLETAGLKTPEEAIRDRRLFRFSWLVLALLLAGYLASQALHIPVSVVAGAAALLLLLVLAARSPAVDVRRLVLEAPWKIVVFSIGMYVVVFGLRNAGLIAILARSLAWAARHGLAVAVFYTGYLAAGLSSVMNNMPTVMVDALAIHASGLHGVARLGAALANVVGSDLGPKITPIGSLATLLWLHVLERRGVKIGWGYYFRVGVTLTLPVLAVTLAALLAVLALQG